MNDCIPVCVNLCINRNIGVGIMELACTLTLLLIWPLICVKWNYRLINIFAHYLFCGSPSRSPHYALHPIYRKPWQSLSVTRDFNLRILHPGIPAKFSNPIILGLAQSNPWIAGWKNFITSDKWVTINSWNSVIGLYNLQMWPSVIVCQELLTFSAICLYKQVHSVNLMVGYAACTVAAK